ncbi:hypothetical protein [Chitiniphilus eburneus]|uniref:hypothetical protein n=1 Tax=Chitiniphilus eburneus TaxID=2571148 RepID=UPI0035CEA0D1
MKDIDQVRRDNLRKIESELGGASLTAKTIGMSLAQFLNLRDGAKDSKTGKPRGMRKDTARKIEAAAHKPTGWLDIDHDHGATEGKADKPAFVSEETWQQLPDSAKSLLGELAQSIVSGELTDEEVALLSTTANHLAKKK